MGRFYVGALAMSWVFFLIFFRSRCVLSNGYPKRPHASARQEVPDASWPLVGGLAAWYLVLAALCLVLAALCLVLAALCVVLAALCLVLAALC